ncbi:hypothetical protein O3P69_020423 [Scylla paramamosain]|uniref:Integrase catalytic domain-containing protein n=1 Tax=Scylla paramamosain TaxID=85552 RepID=A0AAW0TLW8_SCYPA
MRSRVHEEWMRSDKLEVAAAAAEDEPDNIRTSIADLHVRAGHPGIRRTGYPSVLSHPVLRTTLQLLPHVGASLRFRTAYAPSGNGTVERNHRTVKAIAARKHSSITEAIHLYNITPRD